MYLVYTRFLALSLSRDCDLLQDQPRLLIYIARIVVQHHRFSVFYLSFLVYTMTMMTRRCLRPLDDPGDVYDHFGAFCHACLERG